MGEENILMTSGGSLFKLCVKSNVAWPYKECPYFTFIPHLINLFPLFNHGLSQTYRKARERNRRQQQRILQTVTPWTIHTWQGKRFPRALQRVLWTLPFTSISLQIKCCYMSMKRSRSFQKWGFISSLAFLCCLQPVSGCTVQTCVKRAQWDRAPEHACSLCISAKQTINEHVMLSRDSKENQDISVNCWMTV